jgi:hypothetical protein
MDVIQKEGYIKIVKAIREVVSSSSSYSTEEVIEILELVCDDLEVTIESLHYSVNDK